MGMVIPFFPRGTLVGASVWTTYLSDPFDLSDYDSLNVEVEIFGMIGTAPSVVVSIDTADSLVTREGQWVPKSTFATFTAAPAVSNEAVPGPAVGTSGQLGRFVRAKVKVNAPDTAVTLSVTGVARQRS